MHIFKLSGIINETEIKYFVNFCVNDIKFF